MFLYSWSGTVDGAFVHETMDEWASSNVSCSGELICLKLLFSLSLLLSLSLFPIFIYNCCRSVTFLWSLHLPGYPLKAALMINYDPTHLASCIPCKKDYDLRIMIEMNFFKKENLLSDIFFFFWGIVP